MFILLLSCNEHPGQIKMAQIDSLGLRSSENKEFFGNWSLCSWSTGNKYYFTGICRTIVIDSNGFGKVGSSDFQWEYFRWTLKDSKMEISYDLNFANKLFPDTLYYMRFNKEQDFIELKLTHGITSYYLTRGKRMPSLFLDNEVADRDKFE